MEDPVMQARAVEVVDTFAEDGLALWKKHFTPVENSDKVIQVPEEWINFITLALLTPDNFEWAKALLNSKLWHYIIEGAPNSHRTPFVLPDVCHSQQAPLCKMQELEQEASSATAFFTPHNKKAVGAQPMLPSTTTAVYVSKKRKEKAPLVDTEVRRSDRLQQLNKGFRRQTCQANPL